MTASQLLGFHRFMVPFTLPANFGAYLGLNSQAGGSANASGSTVINIDKALTASATSYTNIGTITFASNSVTPTFATAGGAGITFAAGDCMRLVAPASPDATFANFFCTIVGYRT